jgi:hypothetical protein
MIHESHSKKGEELVSFARISLVILSSLATEVVVFFFS